MRTIAYLRVSTEEQADEGISLDAQEAAVRGYCALRGLDLVDVITDPAVSAGKPIPARPGGRRLLDEIRAGRAEAVVAFKLDRLFRSALDCLTVVDEWDRRRVALHLVDYQGGSLDTRSPMGRCFLTMAAAFAELELAQIRERTRAAMARKRERGEYCGGAAPYGFRAAGAKGDAERPLLPVEDEQRTVGLVLDFHTAGLSLRGIGRELDARGIEPRTGKRWHPETIRSIIAYQNAA